MMVCKEVSLLLPFVRGRRSSVGCGPRSPAMLAALRRTKWPTNHTSTINAGFPGSRRRNLPPQSSCTRRRYGTRYRDRHTWSKRTEPPFPFGPMDLRRRSGPVTYRQGGVHRIGSQPVTGAAGLLPAEAVSGRQRCRWRAGPACCGPALVDLMVVRGSAWEAASCTSRSGAAVAAVAIPGHIAAFAGRRLGACGS